jgi:hypothetical protein
MLETTKISSCSISRPKFKIGNGRVGRSIKYWTVAVSVGRKINRGRKRKRIDEGGGGRRRRRRRRIRKTEEIKACPDDAIQIKKETSIKVINKSIDAGGPRILA